MENSVGELQNLQKHFEVVKPLPCTKAIDEQTCMLLWLHTDRAQYSCTAGALRHAAISKQE